MTSLYFQLASGVVIVLYWPDMTGTEVKIRAKCSPVNVSGIMEGLNIGMKSVPPQVSYFQAISSINKILIRWIRLSAKNSLRSQ